MVNSDYICFRSLSLYWADAGTGMAGEGGGGQVGWEQQEDACLEGLRQPGVPRSGYEGRENSLV